jgi:hypothetical protein
MTYRDNRGALAKRISKVFGIVDECSIASGPLVEVRTNGDVISLTAHSNDKFSSLDVYDAGKTILREINANAGKSVVTILWPDGRVEQSEQSWNNRTGVTGAVRMVEVLDAESARDRIHGIAKHVLPLARDI